MKTKKYSRDGFLLSFGSTLIEYIRTNTPMQSQLLSCMYWYQKPIRYFLNNLLRNA